MRWFYRLPGAGQLAVAYTALVILFAAAGLTVGGVKAWVRGEAMFNRPIGMWFDG